MTDQEALGLFVKKHRWKWQIYDWYYWKTLNIIGLQVIEYAYQISTLDKVDAAVYAGDWIEGRLQKMLGDKFGELLSGGKGLFLCTYTLDGGKSYKEPEWKPTPIQAYLAALEAILPEVKHD